MSTTSDARESLSALLRDRNEHPERLSEIDARIWKAFGATRAVLVLDMSGFSRLTARYGVIHFLAMIERMQNLVLPIVSADQGGRVIKCEADNVFATFADVPAAVAVALTIHERLDAANAFLPADWDIHVSVGIGYGELLIIDGHDLYGGELNLASKLGEDVGRPGEVLLTEAAFARLPEGERSRGPAARRETKTKTTKTKTTKTKTTKTKTTKIGGLVIPYYVI